MLTRKPNGDRRIVESCHLSKALRNPGNPLHQAGQLHGTVAFVHGRSSWVMLRSTSANEMRARLFRVLYMAGKFFEGSVTEPQRTFVTDLATDLCNKTSWLVTHPSLHTPRYTPLVTHPRYTPSLHTSDEQARRDCPLFCRGLACVQ